VPELAPGLELVLVLAPGRVWVQGLEQVPAWERNPIQSSWRELPTQQLTIKSCLSFYLPK
jgi:hypothetical protein